MKSSALLLASLRGALVATQASALAQTASPSPAASASPAPAEDPAITARAKDWLHRLETNDIDRAQLSAEMSDFLTPDRAKQLAAKIGVLGDPTSFTLLSQQTMDGYTVYMYRAVFKGGIFKETFALDSAGKIAGLRLSPST